MYVRFPAPVFGWMRIHLWIIIVVDYKSTLSDAVRLCVCLLLVPQSTLDTLKLWNVYLFFNGTETIVRHQNIYKVQSIKMNGICHKTLKYKCIECEYQNLEHAFVFFVSQHVQVQHNWNSDRYIWNSLLGQIHGSVVCNM